MIEILKKFWEKCGEERFSAKVMLIITTLLTLHIVTSFYPPELNLIVIVLNVIMVMAYIFGDEK